MSDIATVKGQGHLKLTEVWNNGIIFRPRAGELGILIITRRFDSDRLTQIKAQAGPDAPLGKRIV